MILKENYYILTGGPGVGKTSLINALNNKGYKCVAEVARQIIQNQTKIGGEYLPWKNALEYSRMMQEASISDFVANHEVSENLFFDRGIPDTLGYEILMEFPKNEFLIEMSHKLRYNSNVFILPPWKEIYENDAERKQNFDEATKTYEVMKKVYTSCDYNLIEIPPCSVDERVHFVLSKIDFK